MLSGGYQLSRTHNVIQSTNLYTLLKETLAHEWEMLSTTKDWEVKIDNFEYQI